MSKAAWKKWQDAGRPASGSLAEEKKQSKRRFRHFVVSAKAVQVQFKFQARDPCSRRTILCISKVVPPSPTLQS